MSGAASPRADVVIIGAGIAGAGLAAALAGEVRVTLIEAEASPGYHATGRSAAFWSESYGGPDVQPLTAASGSALAERGVLGPRGALHIADAEGLTALDGLERDFAGRIALERLGGEALTARVPGLGAQWLAGIGEPSTADIDVAALHAALLGEARAAGADLRCDTRLIAATRGGGRWTIETSNGPIGADLLVNAAGAWADEVARRAGARPLGITPYRRTMLQLRVDPAPAADMPLVLDALGRFYFKPEGAGRLWLSPHDESACAPGDAAPEEIDVALAIDRLERATRWRVLGLDRAWAGLRSFAPDRRPVYGFDARVPGLFWCAGQGGFGIQTAPAASRLAADLLLGMRSPSIAGIDPERYAPGRFG